MITTADINLGTRFGGSVDVPFDTTHVTNDLQLALGRIRGNAIIDTAYTERIDEETHWQYRFLVDATNHRVILERLELFDGADDGAHMDREMLDTDDVEPGVTIEEYERALAHLFRRTKETERGGLTTTRGDAILSAVYQPYAAYPDEEIERTDSVPFDSYVAIEEHFSREEPRALWRALTSVEQIGEARATALILTRGGTEPADVRDALGDEQWTQLNHAYEEEIG